MRTILTHGLNKDCPEVVAGRWAFCQGHVQDDADPRVVVAKLTEGGVARVLGGSVGMTFVVDHFSPDARGTRLAHVLDYRHMKDGKPQGWSIPADGYEIVTASPPCQMFAPKGAR